MRLSSLMVAFFVIYVVLGILQKSISWHYFFLAVIIFAALLFLKFEIDYYRIISNYFFLIIIIYWLTKDNLLKIFIVACIAFVLMAFAEIILFAFLLGFKLEIVASLWTNVAIIMIASGIYYCLRSYLRRINNLNFHNNILLLFFVSILIILIAFFVHRLYFQAPLWGNLVVSLLGLIMLLIFLLIIFRERQNYQWLTSEYQKIAADHSIFMQKVQEYQLKQHDYCNELLYLRGLVNCPKEQKFIDKKIKGAQKNHHLEEQSGIKGFLKEKVAEMQAANIKVVFWWDVQVALVNNDLDFVAKIIRVLGNLVDNAREASLKNANPQVEILVWEEKNNIGFSIANNYAKNANFCPIMRKKFTKKSFGLYIVHNIVSKEKDCTWQSRFGKHFFYQELFIRKRRFFEIK